MAVDASLRAAARGLRERLGAPDVGVVLGSGFCALAGALAADAAVEAGEVPGLPAAGTGGHEGRILGVELAQGRGWVFAGRVHLYEGLGVDEVTRPVALLAAAGARALLSTCAAGGLADGDEPGDLVLVRDHINLTGCDPMRSLPPRAERPRFLDLQRAYDPALARAWHEAAAGEGVALRDGVLAAVGGPCYETPAEVRMLRRLGADVVSMSVVPEAIAACHFGLRTAALACVSNRGAGLDGGRSIDHGDVLERVSAAVAARCGFFRRGLDGMLRALGAAVPSFDGPTPSR